MQLLTSFFVCHEEETEQTQGEKVGGIVLPLALYHEQARIVFYEKKNYIINEQKKRFFFNGVQNN